MADTMQRYARLLSPAFKPVAIAIGAVTLALSAWWLVADALRVKPSLAAGLGAVRS